VNKRVMKRSLGAVVVAAQSFCAWGQTAEQTRQPIAAETEHRITNLSKRFDELIVSKPGESREAAAKRVAAMDEVASQIHGEVDAYLARVVDPNRADRQRIEQDLHRILAHLCDTPPSVFVLDTAKSRSWVAAYGLRKGALVGEHATSVTLRAYSVTDRGVRLAAFTGDDLDGYANLAVQELHSPVPDEVWLLVWGQMTGANGPNIRMRIYACDGKKFRTVWMPENIWGTFTVRVTDQGFTVDGEYYREAKARHDAYQLAPDGLYHVAADGLR
jgi:hypothetical protein